MTTRLTRPISEVCIVTRDLDRALAFYRDTLGFTLEFLMPGFADFTGPGVRLALWTMDHLIETTGVTGEVVSPGQRQAMVAVRLDDPADIDLRYAELTALGVTFFRPPADYPWNARCVYFEGPDGELWELYAWHEGGEPGKV